MKLVFSAGVLVYTYRENKRLFLFLERKSKWLDIPKGHIEKGEHAIDAAIRETEEETGLKVKPDRFFRHLLKYWTRDGGQKAKKTVTVYLAEVPANVKVKVSWEHEDYQWLDSDDALKKSKFKDTKELIDAGNIYIERKEAMERLNEEYRKLPEKISGWNLSKSLVPGEGPLNANVMLVGQAPGRNEDEQGRPFVGISGQLLDKLIRRAGLRRENIYITSVVQFFPPENRVPTDEEIDVCRDFLNRQIKIIDPKIIVVLGAVSAKELLGLHEIMKEHGKLIKKERNYFITLHPAAAVRIKTNLPLIEDDFRKLKGVLAGL